jgi:acetolactate synthase-1/2/3 large subunit
MKTQEKITGAEAVIRCLLAEGVETLFGYPGGAIMPVYDALYDYQDQLKHILVRHEQGAIHAAQGFARASGKVAVCIATSGPGATNLITGLADALIDSTPVVCITGQVSSKLLGTDAFQETDVMSISMPVTKWNVQVTRAADIPAAFAKAFFIAKTGRPGPVLIDVTKDAQFEKFNFSHQKCEKVRSYFPKPVLDKNKLQEAATLLNSAKKPFMLVGQGVVLSGAENELKMFAEKTGVPVASTLLGLGALSCSHPNYVGMLGMHGNYAPNVMTNKCDVLLAVGMRFDDRVTGDLSRYAKQARVVHIDIDTAELNKNVKACVALHADAKEAMNALLDLVETKNRAAWISEFKVYETKEKETLARNTEMFSDELKMNEVVNLLSEKMNGEGIVVTDVGQHQMITSRNYRYEKSKTNVTSGGLGTMGFALPAAIGAKAAMQDKEVVAVIGDGGFQMTVQELGTILQSGLGVKILILNNNFLGMVRQWQEMFFEKRYSFTEIVNPDFVALAAAYKIPSRRVSERFNLENEMERMLNHKGPYLLEVMVEKEENVFPMVPTGASVSEVLLE